MRWFLLFLVLFPLAARADVPADYERSVDTWREERVARLRRPDGWLALAGLFWLGEGTNTFGSAPDADLVFPRSAPPLLGVFRVEGDRVVLEAEGSVTVAGRPLSPVWVGGGSLPLLRGARPLGGAWMPPSGIPPPW